MLEITSKSLKIAICGTRGIPACYGGFETFAEQLSTRLVQKGHSVCVYGRSHFVNRAQKTFQGVELRVLWAPRHKYLETPAHALISFLHLVFHRVDVVLVCNAANSPFIWLPRLFGMPVLINVDGIERMRGKWNVLGRWWYRLGEICSVLFATKIISDAKVIERYYLDTYQASSTVIPYGCDKSFDLAVQKKISGQPSGIDRDVECRALFEELKISADKYILYVSRLEPENNAHVVIAAYKRLPAHLREIPLVIVGDAPYAAQYIAALRESAAQENIIFAGYRFGAQYRMLQVGAAIYVQATEVGGTHPALVEAMGFGNCIIANETPENVEVLANAGRFYQKNSTDVLTQVLTELLDSPMAIQQHRRLAHDRAYEYFNWDTITSDYEKLAFQLLNHGIAS